MEQLPHDLVLIVPGAVALAAIGLLIAYLRSRRAPKPPGDNR